VVRNRMPGGVRGNGGNPVTYSIVRPAGRTYLEVQVLYTPGRGKY